MVAVGPPMTTGHPGLQLGHFLANIQAATTAVGLQKMVGQCGAITPDRLTWVLLPDPWRPSLLQRQKAPPARGVAALKEAEGGTAFLQL